MSRMPAADAQAGQWQAALSLVERLLELPEDAREAAIADAHVDGEILALVRRMLSADKRTSMLDSPLPALTGIDAATTSLAGRRFGRWLLAEELGVGGMSVVYRARSLQSPVGQEAAVKLLSLAAATAEGRTRFQREIDILLRLRHPGIAPVHDAGIASDGTPWFSMALVEGIDIATWCREQGPSPRACVALFLQTCDAVAHAHRHLVVHRDIKPSNVLVDAEGHVVLLDFGISRLLEEDDGTTRPTGTCAFTPRYAAPEQRQGGEITTATDVYGLGSLLHQLLTGQSPQFPEGVVDAECRDPASLIDRKTDPVLRNVLAGDLGAILKKSLARDPARRYAGAAEFAADLRAWLGGNPVVAQRDTRLYRFGRFVARHRLPVALAALLALALTAGLGVSLWQRQSAIAQSRRADATQQFLLNVFSEANAATRGDRPPDIRGVLRTAAQQAERDFPGQPQQQVDTLGMVGRLQFVNADYPGAIDTLRRALDLDRSRGAHWDESRRRALLAYAGALRRTGEVKASVATLDAWLAEDRPHGRLTGPHCVGVLGASYPDMHARRAAMDAVLDDCLALPPGDPDRLFFVARLVENRIADGDPDAALALARSEDMRTAALAELPPGAWDDWVVLKAALAQACKRAGDAVAAEQASRSALALTQRHLDRDNPFQIGLLRTHATMLADLGRHAEAERQLRRAIALNGDGDSPRSLHEAAPLRLELGNLAFQAGDYRAAIAAYRDSLQARERAGEADSFDQGLTFSGLAAAHDALDQFDDAARYARRAIALFRSRYPAREDALVLPEYRLCHALASQGDASGLDDCRRAMARETAAAPDDLLLAAEQSQYLAEAFLRLRDWPNAIAQADAAIARIEALPQASADDAAPVLARTRFIRLAAFAASGMRAQADAEWQVLGARRCLAEPEAERARQAWRSAGGTPDCREPARKG
jgi:tetratricopeptide (TPR) repeat protein